MAGLMPRVRVGVVIADGDQLLLVRQRKGPRTYWLLPGGGLDYGEGLLACARREVFEETGLEVEVGHFLYLSEAIAPDRSRHVLNLFVLGRPTGGNIVVPEDDAIEEIAWVPFTEIESLVMHPAIAQQLVASWKLGFAHELRYLGEIWTT